MDKNRTTKSNPISLTRACGGRSGALSASKNKHGSSNLAGAREAMEMQGKQDSHKIGSFHRSLYAVRGSTGSSGS